MGVMLIKLTYDPLKLSLLKRVGSEIYVGPLGRHSSELIQYFEVKITPNTSGSYSIKIKPTL